MLREYNNKATLGQFIAGLELNAVPGAGGERLPVVPLLEGGEGRRGDLGGLHALRLGGGFADAVAQRSRSRIDSDRSG